MFLVLQAPFIVAQVITESLHFLLFLQDAFTWILFYQDVLIKKITDTILSRIGLRSIYLLANARK